MDRNYIIAEIQRTAAANGGVALGRARFAAETGIRPHEWGRHWTRWNEALADAGLRPNRLTRAIPEEELLQTLAAFVRDIGRFPVIAELRTRAATQGFPGHTTWHYHFGSMSALRQRLRTFAEERGYSDVVELCGPLQSRPPSMVPARRKEATNDGFVYLMKSGRNYKIGKTNALGRRERELAIQLPESIRRVAHIRTDDPSGIEEYWHKRFANRRKGGEWFELTAEDVSAFRRRKFM